MPTGYRDCGRGVRPSASEDITRERVLRAAVCARCRPRLMEWSPLSDTASKCHSGDASQPLNERSDRDEDYNCRRRRRKEALPSAWCGRTPHTGAQEAAQARVSRGAALPLSCPVYKGMGKAARALAVGCQSLLVTDTAAITYTSSLVARDRYARHLTIH